MNVVYAQRVRMLLTRLLICFYRIYTYTQLTFTCITRKSSPLRPESVTILHLGHQAHISP